MLLGLRDFSAMSFVVALLVPLAYMAGSVFLPRFIPADRLLLSLVNFLCALGVLVLYRMKPELGFDQAVNYAVGLAWDARLHASGPLLAPSQMDGTADCPGRAHSDGPPGVYRDGEKRCEGLAEPAWVQLSAQRDCQGRPAFGAVLPALKRKILQAILFAGLCLGLLMLQKDLGTALLYYMISLLLVFAATGSITILGLGAVGAGAGAVLGYSMFSHVKRRVAIWIDPWQDYKGNGYQVVQSLVAMANGGLWGTGLGLGDAHRVIPEVQT